MKTCVRCGDAIVGRVDKKFCCDGCRSAYNNSINKQRDRNIRQINSRLRRNYKILSELNTGQKVTASKKKLISKGFDFDFFTQAMHSSHGITFYLYDQGYFPLSNGSYVLIRKEVPKRNKLQE
ncbi:hypothetical protein [Flavobacterium silvaticum]|uniref:DUF2116 family Zn-ribbon domain-containing protein n=1 Tax=Flavobacterium silvaticum TaxID=1852020 RepID=A0A972FVA3_9FLAO|nr:hypothetical protein [Flavobacterium silvaticum]NMH28280.1 hypothetical protein [Flavobacterium silvaticum]